MLGSPILDVALGVVFMFLVLSLLTTAVNEVIATALSRRSKFLEKWLVNFLGDDQRKDAFLRQPMIRSLWDEKGNRTPSYIDNKIFTQALMRYLAGDEAISTKTIQTIDNERVKGVLADLAGATNRTLDDVRADVEKWFDAAMDRVSGWYKRRTHLWITVIALVAAVGLNADTLLVARTLWSSPATRDAVAKAATQYVKDHPDGISDAAARVQDVKEAQIPIGWASSEDDARSWPGTLGGVLLRLLGWIITAAALTLGAPFWFDALAKFVNVRGAGAKPTK